MDPFKTPPPPEGEHIDIQRDDVVEMWAKRLGVTAEEVRDAVRAVGDEARKVEEYLSGGGARTA